ncbi:MAG: alpha/beta fold hydrolase [Anaerolineales bacterium]|nr:alpha/beta fold hydrolase [Anaerolineales bacterium]
MFKTKAKLIIFCILIFALFVNGCTGQVVVTPTAVPTQTPLPAPVRELESVECRTPNPSLIKMECYDLLVPEDRSNPESQMLRLHVAIFRSKSSSPASDPILFLSGGPGQPGIPFVMYSQSFNGFMNSKREVVVFDQRGTGQSQPSLACPEAGQFYMDALNKAISQDEFFYGEDLAWLKCRERLVSAGVELKEYSSAVSAADAEDLRLALNIEQWNLFGISYGTRLALTIMRDYPQGVRSAVLDSVFPLPETLVNYDYKDIRGKGSIKYLLDRCAADIDCQTTYPDLENKLVALFEGLNETPVSVTSTYKTAVGYSNGPEVMLTGDRLLQVLRGMMYSVSDIPVIPKMINDLGNADYEIVSKYLYLVFPIFEPTGMSYSVQCNDNAAYTTNSPVLDSPTPLEEIWFSFIQGDNEFMNFCHMWLPDSVDAQKLVSFSSEIPSLLLAGEFDPATPVWFAELTKDGLPNSYLYEFTGFGHSLTTSDSAANGCVGNLMASFWNDPAVKPDDGCYYDLKPRKFITK